MVIRETAPATEKLYTAEEFWEIAELPENVEKRLELDNGVIIEIAGSKPVNTITAMRVGILVGSYVLQHDLGHLTGADGEFKLAPRIVRQPDVAFIKKERIPKKLPRRFEFAPDLAVEVVSDREDALKKAREYLMYGCQIVWAIYPEDKEVYVIKQDSESNLAVEIFGIEDTLDGGDVLPGFTLKVKDIFPE